MIVAARAVVMVLMVVITTPAVTVMVATRDVRHSWISDAMGKCGRFEMEEILLGA